MAEMTAGDHWVVIQWFGTACCCRCRHCSLGDEHRICRVPFGRAKKVAERFLDWRNEHGITDLSVHITTGYSCWSDEAMDAIVFNKRIGATSWQYIPSNGTRFFPRDDLRRRLAERMELGVTTIGLTFYGLRDLHDAWAGRRGDFDHDLLLAKLAAEVGLNRQETVFISKSGIQDLPELLPVLDALPGQSNRDICPWDYRGRGKQLEEERVTAAQVRALPEQIRRAINPRCKSEAEWVAGIEAGDCPRRDKRAYLISVWEDNIDWLESEDCRDILESIRITDERLNNAIPSLPALAAVYGESAGERLYSLRDLEWKWTDLYLQEHPEIDVSGRFSDLGSVILRQ